MKEIQLYFILSTLVFNAFASDPKVVRIFGKVIGGHRCDQGMSNIWLSHKKLLLYQMEVPIGGEYEFFVKNDEINTYEISATHDGGCQSEKLKLFLDKSSKEYYYEIKLK